jgi:hypothetical protein
MGDMWMLVPCSGQLTEDSQHLPVKRLGLPEAVRGFFLPSYLWIAPALCADVTVEQPQEEKLAHGKSRFLSKKLRQWSEPSSMLRVLGALPD